MCFWCDAAARGCQFSCKTAFSFTFSGFNDSSSADEDEASLTISQTSLQFLGNCFWMMMMSFRFPAAALTYKHRNSLPGQKLQLVMPWKAFFLSHQPLKSDPGSKSFTLQNQTLNCRRLLCSTIQLGVITSVHWWVVTEWVCVCSNTVHTGNIFYVNNTLQIFYS